MGTWDVGPFDNDGASDWAWELEESDNLEVLQAALDHEAGFLDAPEGEIAVAAAAVLTAFVGKSVGVPDEVESWVASHRYLDVRSMKSDALAALDAVVSEESELAELWDESDDSSRWRAAIARIRGILDDDWPAPSKAAPPASTPAPSPQQSSATPWWQFWR